MHRVNASGELYLTHTVVNGQAVLRMAIGSVWTEHRHVAAAWHSAQLLTRTMPSCTTLQTSRPSWV